ncbi:hypothetical protein ACB094_10G148700 [Castanea mollissima]
MVGGRTFIKWRKEFRFLHQIPSGHPHQFFRLTSARHQCHIVLQHTHHFLGSNRMGIEFRHGLKYLQQLYCVSVAHGSCHNGLILQHPSRKQNFLQNYFTQNQH